MFTKLKAWADRPFNPDMDWAGWIFLVVFILVIAGAWLSVLNIIKKAGTV